jgi:2-methylcitrate dehydratase PrpD
MTNQTASAESRHNGGPGELLAEFAVSHRYADLPEAVRDYTKVLAMKCAANMIAGSTMPGSKHLLRIIRDQANPTTAGVLGSDTGTSMWNAVLANAFFAHAAELEDDAFQRNGAVSWTITTIPVAFAVGEQLRASGEQLIEAMAIGLEVQRRTAQAKTLDRGVLVGPGAPGAAAAAGKLFGLDVKQMRCALALAMPGPVVTNVNYGTDGHFFESAMQSLHAVIAAELARAGCTANLDVVGFISDLFGGIDEEKITAGLGDEWLLHDFWLKKYPASMGVHRAVDVTLELVRDHGLSYDEIDRVEVTEDTFGPGGRGYVDWPNPVNNQEAQVSLQYCVGAAIRDGDVDLRHFEEGAVRSSRYREAAAKVRYTPRLLDDYALFSTPQHVVIVTVDGRRFEGQRLYPLGAPEDPLPLDKIVDIYRKYTAPVLSPREIDQTANGFLELEQLDSVGMGALFSALGRGGP